MHTPHRGRQLRCCAAAHKVRFAPGLCAFFYVCKIYFTETEECHYKIVTKTNLLNSNIYQILIKLSCVFGGS